MVVDYSKFKSIEASSSSSEDEKGGDGKPERGDSLVGSARSEEGLLRAFIAIHDRRLEVDRLQATGGLGPEDAAAAYDDVCARLLVLDGVHKEGELRSLGHRAEAAKARLSAAQALLSVGNLEQAEARASLAIDAIYREKEDSEVAGQIANRGRHLLYDNAVDAYLCRAESRLLRGSYQAAREDALMAYSTAQRLGTPEQVKASSSLAVRCEMALTAGGPGLDGKGEPIPLDELSSLQVQSLGACEGACEEGEEEEVEESAEEVAKADAHADRSGAEADLEAAALDLHAMD